MTDIEIARNTKLENIEEIALKCGLKDNEIENYGKYKAKINEEAFKRLENKENGKLILVTAMSPTPLGEGKTTVSIAIADGLNQIHKNAVLALRAFAWSSVWYKRWSNRRWKSSGCSNGRYKSSLYRRHSCNNCK